LKKRYISFELRGPDMGENSLKKAIYSEALRFFGEFGLSEAALKLVEYNSDTKKGILRCERDYLDKTIGFLALISSLEGTEARLIPIKSSGTVKSLAQ